MAESADEPGPLRLLAREPFSPGEHGYATNDGVWHVQAAGASYPANARFVTALVSVDAGRYGDFEEWVRS